MAMCGMGWSALRKGDGDVTQESIRLVRWAEANGVRLGLGEGVKSAYLPVDAVLPGITSIEDFCREVAHKGQTPGDFAREALIHTPERISVADSQLLVPVETSEVWAAGVTYELSRDAREAETTSAQTVYAKVYDAERPELFFKAPGYRVVGPGDWVGLRPDAHWHVPEPELTVVLGETGEVFGYTIGNDMTARDVEAENPLYLPQAKMFSHSTALGPAVVLAGTVDPVNLDIVLEIRRAGAVLFRAEESTRRLRRSLDDLTGYLRRAYDVTPWTALMTGTGIVPPDDLAIDDGDEISITISGIGQLVNPARLIGRGGATT